MSAGKRRNKRPQVVQPIVEQPTFQTRLQQSLFTRVDGASLAAFRICFALAMIWHLAKQFSTFGGGTVIDFLYGQTEFNFPYRGFEWVQPLPGPWLNLLFVVVVLAAVLVGAGLFYRQSAVTMFLGYSYIFLLEQSQYNNHYYLMCLLCLLLVIVPAGNRFSVDAWRTRRRGLPSEWDVPFWSIALLRFQLFVMYFFGGVAKLNSDWLSGSPLIAPAELLHGNVNFILGDWISAAGIALFMAWGGLFYDLSIGFLLLWSRTRILAMLVTFGFHLHNHFVFPIGVFPALAFTATLIFLNPDWPVRLFKLRLIERCKTKIGLITSAPEYVENEPATSAPCRRVVIGFLACWVVFQVGMPLRHYLIEGDANWTEEGQDFSWRMMLRQKAAGSVTFVLSDPQLQYTDDRGNSRIHWQHWPADLPHAIHVPIESHQFNWGHHPGLTVTFEPCLGQRVVQRLGPSEAARKESVKESIAQKWIALYGHGPESIAETISLPEALRWISDNIETKDDTADSSLRVEIINFIDGTLAKLDRLHPGDSNEQFFVEVTDFMTRLANSSYAPIVNEQLRRLHPFALQGADTGEDQFLVVEDASIDDEALQQLAGDEPYLVWVDLGRLTPAAWRQLPRSFVSFESRRLRIIWNHFRELNRVQLDRFTIRPSMIHHYAGHIADSWQSDTGRRPEVRVHSSVMLNYKYPKSLIDPTVDLASVPYERLRHNRWITQLESKPIQRLARR